jgi:quinol monooxygenase YgiN
VTACVQLAEIRTDPARRDHCLAALSRQVDAALRSEPGVLPLLAGADPADPQSLRVFEVYRHACLAHLQPPHFLACKAGVAPMVLSLRPQPRDAVKLGARW